VNDLDASDEDIVAENLHAVQQLYYAYQLERMRVFQVVERIAELSLQGMLPLSTGPAIERWRRVALRSDRLSDSERATLYARALGVPGGATTEVSPASLQVVEMSVACGSAVLW